MKLFAERQLFEVLGVLQDRMLNEIRNEAPNKLLNMNESDYVRYLADKYQVEPIVFNFDAIQITHGGKLIRVEDHPYSYRSQFIHFGRQAYPRQVITFHLPFAGDRWLLNCHPSTYLAGWTLEIEELPNEISFDLVNWQNDAEVLKREKNSNIDCIRKQTENLVNEVAHFNSQLEPQARQIVSTRKSQLLQQASVAESLGIPLRKSASVPQTFAVPVLPKKLAVKPTAPDAAYSPQPTLDLATYQNILSIIHDTGVAMERHPSTYANKQEEDLRDFLLMTLCTHYPNTTGETFNKKGKTDILVRYETSNVFVGECKFWKGFKAFHETIDQILSYLTWRDSKAAIICFVNNKELNPVLEQISTGAPQHPSFVRLESKKSESWTQIEFRLKTDLTRNVHLAVLCFHFPPS
jgi:hypothetical protein